MLIHTGVFAVACYAAAQSELQPGLIPERLYNGMNRPVMLQVTSPKSFGEVALVVMNHDGLELIEPVEVRPGRIDLAEVMPEIWQLERAAFLQLLSFDEPVGSALVLQPMLPRQVPQTEVKAHPTRRHLHSSIIDWRDERLPEPHLQNDEPLETEESEELPDSPPEEIELKDLPHFSTGLRIYVETDAIIRTTLGAMQIAMRPDEAPNTAWNFLELSRGGFYRNVIFHRIVPLTSNGDPFVIQAGDPTSTGEGGPGYWLPIEPSRLPHDFGVISMARADHPDSAGSQIFICLSRAGTARLDGQYCSFGYAVSGADVIQAIASVELADVATGKPVDPPVIKAVELVYAPPRTPSKGRPDQHVTPEPIDIKKQPTRVPR